MGEDEARQLRALQQKEIDNTFTLMYFLVENGREHIRKEESTEIRDAIGRRAFLLEKTQSD